MQNRVARAVAVVVSLSALFALGTSGPVGAEEPIRVYMVNASFCNDLSCVEQSQDTTIRAGQTIEWVFADPACFVFDAVFGASLCYHDAMRLDGPETFNSGAMPGVPDRVALTYQHTFNTPGEYVYYCSLHAFLGMGAKIVVTS